jgi:hypothetical protein
MISELEEKIDLYNSETLRDFLVGKDTEVNFIKFSFDTLINLYLLLSI